MARIPRNSQESAALGSELAHPDIPKSKRAKPAHPWYNPAKDKRSSYDAPPPDTEVLSAFLRDTPLATIEALLTARSVKAAANLGDVSRLVVESLPSASLLRAAILALRLEHADSASLAEHRRLASVIEQLKADQERLAEQLPLELARGW